MKQTILVAAAIALGAAAVMVSCSSKKIGASESATPVKTTGAVVIGSKPSPVGTDPVTALPVAVVYQTSKPCADLVPVTVANGRLISFPAPTDITENSAPIPLDFGYWLSRQGGIGSDTRFTNWTFAEYSALKAVPSPAEILANLSDAKVTDVKEIKGMTPWQAAADTAAVNRIIRAQIPRLED